MKQICKEYWRLVSIKKSSLSLLLLLVLLPLFSFSQELNEELLKGGNYYYGEGISPDLEIAKKNALADLANQLQTIVKVSTELAVKDGVTYYINDIEAETNIFIRNAKSWSQTIGKGKNIQYHVISYVSKKELEDKKIEKMKAILGYIKEGDEYLKNKDVSKALERYYWALTLTSNDWMLCYTQNLEGTDYFVNDFRKKIEDILDDIEFKSGKRIAFASFVVKPYYKGEYIKNLKYASFIDGKWQNVTDTILRYDEFIPDTAKLQLTFENFDELTLTDEAKHLIKNKPSNKFLIDHEVILPPHEQITQIAHVPGERGFIYAYMQDKATEGIVMYGNQYIGRTPIMFQVSTGYADISIQDINTGHTKKFRVPVTRKSTSMVMFGENN